MVVVFGLGILIDLWLANRLGQSSLLLLLVVGLFTRLEQYLPKKIESSIKLK